jgi:hypothetical protein
VHNRGRLAVAIEEIGWDRQRRVEEELHGEDWRRQSNGEDEENGCPLWGGGSAGRDSKHIWERESLQSKGLVRRTLIDDKHYYQGYPNRDEPTDGAVDRYIHVGASGRDGDVRFLGLSKLRRKSVTAKYCDTDFRNTAASQSERTNLEGWSVQRSSGERRQKKVGVWS